MENDPYGLIGLNAWSPLVEMFGKDVGGGGIV